MRDLRAIAVAAKVAEVKLAQVSRDDLLGGVRSGGVRQMAMATQDALLDAPRTPRIVLKQLEIMIGLEDKDI